MVPTMDREVIEENPAPIRLSPPQITNGLTLNSTGPQPHTVYSFIKQSVMREAHILFQSKLPTQYYLLLPHAISSTFYFH